MRERSGYAADPAEEDPAEPVDEPDGADAVDDPGEELSFFVPPRESVR